MDIRTLQAIFFDFDGVLVDSNHLKNEAFRTLFKEYDDDVVEAVLAYHRQHGGVSRVEKIRYAFKNILRLPLPEVTLQQWATAYSNLVVEQVVQAPQIAGAHAFLCEVVDAVPLFVISGTPQNELRDIIRRRDMAHFFTAICGSPDTKYTHIRQLQTAYKLESSRCVFIGDAFTDYDAAVTNGLHFIGIQGDYDFPPGVTVLPDCTLLKEAITQVVLM